ncbi:sulfur reduction protein DsrS [Candidatus Venteria ishoeyi]|uniref:Sulfur reduction protein DsrS n=1 Tax=Candidatus Venteria ishoeyi TaxID=1899563 RepID=A0A1H6FC43_9GAMM|nr:sulfur reduction protein DsrS [Candidatus Venteria ishoeyi]MDM8545189.1 hypothetical protein [Candidatus Venteria ishoeyi]SEH06716.1 Uncharacterised protein [Candidatus Venteria ishoeyi]
MSLSNEDNLRLNVLLAGEVKAIRINESSMTVHALTPRGEAKVKLNANCRDEQYLRQVRELISAVILGSPEGYPVYISRWIRMGQARDESLEQLLKLGEPEAVIAVVHAPGLTPELAKRAWWAAQETDNARQMLQKSNIINSELGKELAQHILEFLPFEEEPMMQAESVQRILQPGLLNTAEIQDLWHRGQHKNSYLLGFLRSDMRLLPEQQAAHDAYTSLAAKLKPLTEQNNPVALLVLKILSPEGQSFIQLCERVLKKPINQDIVNHFIVYLAQYFTSLKPDNMDNQAIESLLPNVAQACCMENPGMVTGLNAVLKQAPELQAYLQAMMTLAALDYGVLRPIFSRTSSIGSLMRKKLKPVTSPIFEQLKQLRQPINI